jgi:hypothetical protein
MNQSQKDSAWKIFGIAFVASLVLFVLIDWKSFVVWLIRFVADRLKDVVLLFALVGATVLIQDLFSDHD